MDLLVTVSADITEQDSTPGLWEATGASPDPYNIAGVSQIGARQIEVIVTGSDMDINPPDVLNFTGPGNWNSADGPLQDSSNPITY